MDPVLFSLPEIISDGEEPGCTQSGFSHFSPHYQPSLPADRSAPQEDLDFHSLSEPFLQTRCKIFSQSGQFCPSEPHFVMDESTLPRASAGPEKVQTRAMSDQRPDRQSCIQSESIQQSVHHLISNLTGPIEPHIQTQDSLCPLRLQAVSPGDDSPPGFTSLLPEFICSHCSPPDSCWINVSPVTSTPNSRSGFSPCVLVPADSPAGIWHSPCVHSCSVVVMPEIRPCWCVCPHKLQVHQPCSPYQVLSREAQHVSQQLSITPDCAVSGSPSFLLEEQQKNETPDKDKLQVNNTDDEATKLKVSPASRPSLSEDLVEKYKMIMDLVLKVQKDVKASGDGNEGDVDDRKEKLETEDSLSLEYLEELCSDEDFVRNVGMILNVEYLESLFSADPELIDLLAWIEQEQELGPDTNPNPPLSVRNIASKKENSIISVPEATDKAEEPEATFPTEEVSENVSMSLSDLADTHSAQTPRKIQEGPLAEDPPASEAPSFSSDSAEEPDAIAVMDPLPGFRVDLWTGSPPQLAVPQALNVLTSLPAQKMKTEECSPKSINPTPSCLEDYTVPVPANSSFETASSDSVSERQTEESPQASQASREQNKENQNRKHRDTVNKVQTRRSQRLSGKAVKNNTRKPSAKSIKKTEKFTRQTDGATYEKQTGRSSLGRQLFKGDGSQASKAATTDEQFSGNEKMEHQTLAGEKQYEANNSDVSTESEAENSLSTTKTREENEPNPEQTEGVEGEDQRREQEEAEHPSLPQSPIKRYRHGLPAERETIPKDTGTVGSSPTKRGRWKGRREGDEEQKWTGSEEDEVRDTVETPGCQPRPPSTRGEKAKDGLSAPRGKNRAAETGAQPAKRLPAKCESLVLCTTRRHKPQLDKRTGKAGEKQKC